MSTPDPATRTRVIATIAEILEIDPTNVVANLRLREDLGMDSLGSLELLSSISEELRLDLEMEDAMEIVTVEDACTFVERHREAAEDEFRANVP